MNMKNNNYTMSTEDKSLHLQGWRLWYFLSRKFIDYCVRYYKQPYYLYLYFSKSLSDKYKEEVNFIKEKDIIKAASKISTIRFGDGEFGLMTSRKNIHFQSADPKLINKLFEIAQSYNQQSPFILGVNFQIAIANQFLEHYKMKFLFMQQKLGFHLYFNKSMTYFNASFYYIDGMAKLFLKEVSTNKSVVIVTKNSNIERLASKAIELFPRSYKVSYIRTPEVNAYSEYDRILVDTLKISKEKNSVVLVGCGPAGKLLVYDLARQGFIAHDIGHGLEFALDESSHEHLIKWAELKSYIKC